MVLHFNYMFTRMIVCLWKFTVRKMIGYGFMKSKKIGCLTWHNVYNFGSELQAYALQETISSLGYNSEFISYNNENSVFSKLYQFFCEIRAIFTLCDKGSHGENFIRFRREYLKCSRKKYNTNNIDSANDVYSKFICGSDQIWAPNVFDPTYFLSFAKKKKISYAASIGLNEIPCDLLPHYRELLSDFYTVSVRENEGKNLLKSYCNIDSVVMPDPTMLLNRKQWEEITINPRFKKPYVFCYFLNKQHKYKNIVTKMVQQGIEIVGVSASKDDASWMKIIENAGPREFLGYVKNADMVFTDSFHGSIFSLIFHKQLWIFERFANEDPLCQNSRIYQLAREFSIADRILTKEAKPLNLIDFDSVQLKLDENIVKGRTFLKQSLED